ncbi:homoserine dehydrogenase [Fodinisporobacter ferrooxydans]|uniref:Homoserine dehydrogenase n=1 Tax=Fodinisporobacter ferrooxydans TaxID=2901836 RepID=A0ABY4CQD2_9BACL|nr:homoserine dehydrogenase [Alicyclobacillaceae bacterium MYW30-H2]
MQETIKVGLMGLGTVGSGVYQVLNENGSEIALRASGPIEIAKILVRDMEKERAIRVPGQLFTTDPYELVNDPEIDVIVEVMGGFENTLEILLAAIERKKSVVTANKDLIAVHGHELMDKAANAGVDFLFEASVAGGIPIIRPLIHCLAGNRIEEIMGIINGTTNFILSKMTNEKVSFAAALQEAQELGYAEADPTSDVEGLDAARKIAILASLAFNSQVTFSDVTVKGISSVTDRDVMYADQLGYVVKLIARAREVDGEIEAIVRPTFVPKDHPLAAVGGAYNAVFVKGNAVGEAMFHGLGAGSLPTASAVVGDIIEAVRNIHAGVRGKVLATSYHEKPIRSEAESVGKHYIRLVANDKPGVLGTIAAIFGETHVSIESMVQRKHDGNSAELVFVTHDVRYGDLQNALAMLSSHTTVTQVHQVLQVI